MVMQVSAPEVKEKAVLGNSREAARGNIKKLKKQPQPWAEQGQACLTLSCVHRFIWRGTTCFQVMCQKSRNAGLGIEWFI